MSGHSPWDELAVGHALGALEPEDEHTFRDHLRGCTQCAETLAQMEAVSAEMAYAVPADEPPPALLESIMREVHASDRVVARSSRSAVAELRAPRRPKPAPQWNTAWLSRAAVVLGLVALVGWNYQLRMDSQVKQRSLRNAAAAAALMADPATTTVRLEGAGDERATVLVKGEQAYLVVDNFERNDSKDTIYVLWSQTTPESEMKGVETFKVTADRATYIPVRAALTDSGEIRAFAVSRENGSEIPATPSEAIVSGERTPGGTAAA